MPKEYQARLKRIAECEDRFLQLGVRMGQAYGGALYPLDLLAFGAIKRTLSLASGFRSMLEAENFLCAASLLRLQLDTAFRFYGAYLAPNPHDFALAVMQGKQIRSLKDRRGKKMTDGHLVRCLSLEAPWMQRVYDTTCGYVHLSERHILSSFRGTNSSAMHVNLEVGSADEFSVETFSEAAEAFLAAVSLLERYLEGWVATKNDPETAEKLRNQRDGLAGARQHSLS